MNNSDTILIWECYVNRTLLSLEESAVKPFDKSSENRIYEFINNIMNSIRDSGKFSTLSQKNLAFTLSKFALNDSDKKRLLMFVKNNSNGISPENIELVKSCISTPYNTYDKLVNPRRIPEKGADPRYYDPKTDGRERLADFVPTQNDLNLYDNLDNLL
jgi:hypothetical protein